METGTSELSKSECLRPVKNARADCGWLPTLARRIVTVRQIGGIASNSKFALTVKQFFGKISPKENSYQSIDRYIETTKHEVTLSIDCD